MNFRAMFLGALVAVLAARSAAAQPTAGHQLQGVVRDSTGAVMVAVDVTLIPSAGGEPQVMVTDTEGRFTFPGLPLGAYHVVAAAPGFSEAAQTVQLKAEPLALVELILQVVAAEHVEVASEVQLLASSGLSSAMFTGAALEALPDDPGGLLQRVRELAGVTDPGAVTVTVDGFRQLQWLPPKHAIQAIRIAANWFAPEFAEPGQARIEIITKPGATTWRGDVTANFNDEAMNARNALATQHPDGHMRQVTGYVSGPVIPRRLSFVVYSGYWGQEENRAINATVLDRSHHAASYLDTITAPSRVDNLWAGLTYQIAPAHTLATSFSATTDRASKLGLDSGLDLPERAYRRFATDRALRATLTSVPSNRILNEIRVQLRPQDAGTQADSSAPAVIVFDAFNRGGNQEALFASSRHFDAEVNDSLTLFLPRHTLKAGVEARAAQRRYTDTTNSGGIFLFGADFDRDPAGKPVETANGERVVISPLEGYRRTLLGLPGYGPSQFWMTIGDSDVRFRESAAGAFAQDDWTLSPRLTLSYGVRSEWQSASADVSVGARAGLAVALDDGRKNIVRAGTGSFYQRIEPEVTLDVMRHDGAGQQQVRIDRPSFFADVPHSIADMAASSTTRYVEEDLRTPQVLVSALSYERALKAGASATLKYSYQHGSDLLRTRIFDAASVAGSDTDARPGRVLQYESTGRLQRHEVTSGWRWNAGDRGGLAVNYSYVHGQSDTDHRSTLPADGSRLDQELGPTAADRAHAANLSAHFTLPGNLFVSPYVVAASGRAFNITTGLDNNGDGVFLDRPALVAADTPGAITTGFGTFLADPEPGDEVVERNAGREPAAVRVDLRVARTFRYTPRTTMVFAANVENVFNRANYEGVNGVVTSPAFGVANRAGTPRRVNLSASFSF